MNDDKLKPEGDLHDPDTFRREFRENRDGAEISKRLREIKCFLNEFEMNTAAMLFAAAIDLTNLADQLDSAQKSNTE